MTIVLGLLSLLLIAFLIYRHRRRELGSPLSFFYLPAVGLKLGAGIALGVLYSYYYQVGDTLSFDAAAIVATNLGRSDFSAYFEFFMQSQWQSPPPEISTYLQQPRSLLVIKILSLNYLMTGDNYWISTLYFSFFSFTGFWYLAKKLAALFPEMKGAALISMLIFPSVVFWSSGIIKESLAMGAICFGLGLYLKLIFEAKYSIFTVVAMVATFAMAYSLKYYYFILLLPPLLATAIVTLLPTKSIFSKPAPRLFAWLAFLATVMLAASFFHPNFYFSRLAEVVSSHHDQFVAKSDPEDIIHYNGLNSEITSVMSNAPLALVSGLFRPLPWETGGWLKMILSLENLLLVVLAVGAIFNWRKWPLTGFSLLLCSVIFYVVSMATFMALSAPNFGTLARYRVGYLPFFVFLLVAANPWLRKFKWLH